MTGSDARDSDLIVDLERQGADVEIGHDAANLPDDADLLIRSAAVPETNPEVAKALARGLPISKYSKFLGRLSAMREGIAVSGCHGKTTTTSMIVYLLARAGLDPSFVVGGSIPQFRRGGRWADSRHFVVEACEFDRSFLELRPACAVITNIEEDHLDYYADLDEIEGAFADFAGLATSKLVGCADNPRTASVLARRPGIAESYSINGVAADWKARNIRVEGGRWSFEVVRQGKPFGDFTLEVPGLHNVSNALAAIAVGTWAGVGKEILQVALAEFTGAARRFQLLGERRGVTVIDDYAHHPTEIRATLRAARERYPDRKLWCVFQPHQHSRTRIFLEEFARSFGDAHLVLVPEVFSARDSERDMKTVTAAELTRLMDRSGTAALFMRDLSEALDFVRAKIEPGSLLLTLGAGDVGRVAKEFMEGDSDV